MSPKVRRSSSTCGWRRSWRGCWSRVRRQPGSRASACGAWSRSPTRSRFGSRSCSSTTTRATTGSATTTEDDEASRLEGDLLDLEPLLRDAVVLALPFQPLCEDDCPGLCTECGARLKDDPGPRARGGDRPAVEPAPGTPAGRRMTRGPTAEHAVARARREQWLSRSGRCRAATRATVARSGRPSRRPS